MNNKFITLLIVNLIFLFSAEAENTFQIESISEALQGPYQYQTVNVITGEYCESCIDLSLKDPCPLELRRYYTSHDPIAQGWHFNHPNILHAENAVPPDWIPESLHYTFDQQNRLTAISAGPGSPERIRLRYQSEGTVSMDVEDEDGRLLQYTFETYQTSRAIHPYVLTQLKDQKGREINYQYADHPTERKLLLKKREEPEGRYLITEYYDASANNVGGKIVIIDDLIRDPRIGRVKLQKAPVGPDHSPVITNRFFYQPGQTEVYDALGNKTVYQYGNFQKLISVDHYLDEHTLYRKERMFWDGEGKMTSRAIEDKDGSVSLLHTYDYDSFGNVVKTTVWGNLSGTSSHPVEIYLNGQPIDQKLEHYSTTYDYSEDGKFLLQEKEDNGLIKRYCYQNGKLTAKLIGEEERIHCRNFYHYNEDGMIIQEIEDDGSSFQESDLSNVTERRYTRISPMKEGPGKGKPEIIEQGFLDLGTMQEILLNKILLAYAANGEIAVKTALDANLNLFEETTYAYDSFGRLIYTANHKGEEQQFEYDLQGNLTKQVVDGLEMHCTYDFANRLIKKEHWKDEELQQCISYRYDYAGNMTASTDANGNETHYIYDPMGRLIKTILPAMLNSNDIPVYPTTKESYDIFDRVVESTDPKGYCTKTSYNARGNPIAVIHPDGTQEFFNYNLDGSLRKKISRQGLATHFQRDLFSRVTKETCFDLEGRLVGEKIFTYSPFRLISETSMDGCLTTYTYDGAGRQIKIAKEDRYKLEITYDAAGQIESKKEWYGDDQDECVIGMIERGSQNEVIAMAIQDSKGQILRHREVPSEKKEENAAFQEAYDYNSLGQLVLKRIEVDSRGDSTSITFDALNRPVSIEKRNSLGTLLTKKEIRYDLSGNKEKEIHDIVKNGEKKGVYAIHWAWGPNNRLESVTEGLGSPLARTTTYHYNNDGFLNLAVKPDNVSISFEYDSKGAIARLVSSDGTVDYSYKYNDAGRVAEIADNLSGTLTKRSYDPYGKMIQETLANGMDFRYDYDLLGRLRQLTLPDKSKISWEYNAAYLTAVTRLSKSCDALYSHQYTAYDLDGRLLESHMIGELGPIHYEYQGSEISSIHSLYWSQGIEYDSLGRIASLNTDDPIGTLTNSYEYDDLDQIVSEAGLDQHGFSYDSIGNLASIDGFECSVDGLNQLLGTGSHAMTYDKNGQIIECWDNGQHFFFTYDALGRLLTVKKEKELLVSFTYDPFGRRMTKSVSRYFSKDHTYRPETFESYLWEGENEIGAVSSGGEIVQLRVLGFGLGAEVGAAVAFEINQKLYAPIHDHRGNVGCLIDADSGAPVQWYHYSAFGKCTPFSQQYKPVDNPWKFSSKRVDQETNLIYFGKRYYMPGVARWISKDPLGTPDSVNRYAYSLNQPMTRIDPFGLFSFGDLWNSVSTFIGNACHYAHLSLQSLKNSLSFENSLHQTIAKIGELTIGKTLLLLGGYYKHQSESGIYGKGELNDKVRITLINGILNARCNYKESLDFISNAHGGVNIHYLFDATNGWTNDMLRAFLSRMGYTSSTSYKLAEMWKQLIDEMGGIGEGGLIIHYAHSIGATHTKNALNLLSPEERAMIRIYTFGSPTMISDPCLENVKNFISYRDGVPLLDPIGFFSGLFGLSETISMVGSPWGIPFIEHTLNGGVYLDIINILGIHFLKHYVGKE
ncbi:RHS repeat-associated core domain-containing protein [Waddlia chondrophila]|uniref:Putative rhs family protein n=1 Tax=Waddlia chondrophila (strain ATCC VR-1470 / WSU 86-1044) TaxID=716544 RepID=D6YT00_WADCW|nr:RHS repeat-associated core domain-containing protein [Waddlia chondrophila]ADI39195.1 putative rhs family protein [Waddlia chondrophila WSU 86-1044]